MSTFLFPPYPYGCRFMGGLSNSVTLWYQCSTVATFPLQYSIPYPYESCLICNNNNNKGILPKTVVLTNKDISGAPRLICSNVAPSSGITFPFSVQRWLLIGISCSLNIFIFKSFNFTDGLSFNEIACVCWVGSFWICKLTLKQQNVENFEFSKEI